MKKRALVNLFGLSLSELRVRQCRWLAIRDKDKKIKKRNSNMIRARHTCSEPGF